MTVDFPDLPGVPAWDDAAADELAAAVATAGRVLDEQWQLFDRGWWELLTTWTGRARADYNARMLAARGPVEELRAELAVLPERLEQARAGAHEVRQRAYYQLSPGLGLAWDVLDRVVG